MPTQEGSDEGWARKLQLGGNNRVVHNEFIIGLVSKHILRTILRAETEHIWSIHGDVLSAGRSILRSEEEHDLSSSSECGKVKWLVSS